MTHNPSYYIGMRMTAGTLLQYSFGITLVVSIARSLLPGAFALLLWLSWFLLTASVITWVVVRRKQG